MAYPFRFGCAIFRAESGAHLAELAKRAEALGYSTLLIPDHFQPQLAPLAALMSAANATTTLRVGSFVFNSDFRHPALLAKEAATIDLLSGGRFELGIGAGWAEREYTRAGIPFEPARERIDRLAEALQIIKGLFRGGPVSFTGRHYQIEGLEGYPLPLQQPHPPFVLGGAGRRMLALAAREGDVVSCITSRSALDAPSGESATDALRRMIDWVRDAPGTRWPELELNTFYFDVAVDDNSVTARETIARKRNVSVEDVEHKLPALAGSPGQIIEHLQRQREEFGISYITVISGADEVEAMAPVIARLAGR